MYIKKILFNILNEFLTPIRTRREEYEKNILNDGIWFEFKEQEIANVDKILYEINKRKEREGMIKWKENKFIKLFNKLVNLKQKDYENEIK